MTFLVQFEGPCSGKTLQTDFAAERFDHSPVSSPRLREALQPTCLVPVSMHILLMNLQSAVEEKGLPTQITHEGFGGAVDEHMGFELVVVREALSALLTAKGCLTCVDADVPLQVVVQAEACTTNVTGEGLFSCMYNTVTLEGCTSAI